MITIRASSLPSLFDCPARWEATQIEKRRMPSTANATIGHAVHAGTAAYDVSVIQGAPITMDDCAGVIADAIHHPEDDVDWGEDKPNDAEKISIALGKKYCAEISPTQTYAAVEATCERLEIIDLDIALTGTVDRIYTTPDGYGVADLKTGKNAVDAQGNVHAQRHAAQLGIYELLAEHSAGITINAPALVVGMNVAKTDAGRRVKADTAKDCRSLLLGSGEDDGLLHYAARLLHSGSFFGNPRSMMCHAKYCPIFNTCKFKR